MSKLTTWLRNKIKDLIPQKCYLCQQFGKSSYRHLTIHHRDLDTRNSSQQNLVMLCPKCHKLIHELITLKYKKDMIVRSYLEQEKLK